ncbi:MAG: glycosyltransferase family 39 protein [Chloroflexi bacterium]|nr:glycosyltransferase family 39 protein [Chloroflexota bacterium]
MMGASVSGSAQRGRAKDRALTAALAIVIILLASAARFHRLGAQSLWYDEGVAYAHSLRTLPELIPHLQNNVHVPAYFALLGWWQDFTGSSEFALRLLSALFSVLSVAWAYALGARLFHPIAGLAAAALVALNSFSIYYAQEARMYAMLTAVAAASMWLLVGLLRRPSSRSDLGGGWGKLIGLGLVNALGMYTHVAYALVMLTQVALAALACCAALFGGRSVAGLRRPTWQPWIRLLLPFVITFLLFLPWLLVAVSQLSAQPNLSQPLPLDESLRQILGFFAVGNTFELSMGNLTFVAWLFLLAGLIPAAARPRALWNIALPVAWVVISAAVYLHLGLTDRYLRFLLPAQLAFALWLGRGFWILWALPTREMRLPLRAIPKLAAALGIAVYLLALLGELNALYHHRDLQRDDVRGLTARIESELREGDAVLVSAAGFGEVLDYYYRGDAPVYGLPLSADANETASDVLSLTLRHKRIFAIFYGSEEQDPKRAVEINLNVHSYQASQEWVGDMRFARYIVPDADSFDERHSPDLSFGDDIRLARYWTSAEPVARGEYLLVGIIWLAERAPEARYKVFLQLLDAEGRLVAQRDSEPAGGARPTSTWDAGNNYYDYHALLIPEDLPADDYTLIAGLYDINDPAARLPVGDSTYFELGKVTVDGDS